VRRKGRQTDLAGALSSVARALNSQSKGAFFQVRVADEWEKLAGPTVAAHTTGAHLRSGELVIHVDSPAWSTELNALAGPYTEAMNLALGHKVVKSMRFTVSRRVQDSKRRETAEERTSAFYAPDSFDPLPLSSVEVAQVEASVPDVGDEGLRQAAIRATIAGLEWQKGRRASKSAENASGGL